MRTFGFSIGAVAKAHLIRYGVEAVELSALRAEELQPLMQALLHLDLRPFRFVSFHAPSRFDPSLEGWVLQQLRQVVDQGIPVVVHPDVIANRNDWQDLGSSLLIENMDRRKPIGRTSRELAPVFDSLPEARLCFDIGHARQVDPTMTEAMLILCDFGDKLAEVHISEVNTSSRHDPLSINAIAAFRSVSSLIPEDVPVILETLVDNGQSDIPTQVARARQVFESPVLVHGPGSISPPCCKAY
jgi:hypothetical protein